MFDRGFVNRRLDNLEINLYLSVKVPMKPGPAIGQVLKSDL